MIYARGVCDYDAVVHLAAYGTNGCVVAACAFYDAMDVLTTANLKVPYIHQYRHKDCCGASNITCIRCLAVRPDDVLSLPPGLVSGLAVYGR